METSTAMFLYCKHLERKCEVCGGMADATSWHFCQWDGHSAYHKLYIAYFHNETSMCTESYPGWYPHHRLKDIVGHLGFVEVDHMVFSPEIWWPSVHWLHGEGRHTRHPQTEPTSGPRARFLSGVMPGHGVQILLIWYRVDGAEGQHLHQLMMAWVDTWNARMCSCMSESSAYVYACTL